MITKGAHLFADRYMKSDSKRAVIPLFRKPQLAYVPLMYSQQPPIVPFADLHDF